MQAFLLTVALTVSAIGLALVGVEEPPPVLPPAVPEAPVIPAHAAACYELGY